MTKHSSLLVSAAASLLLGGQVVLGQDTPNKPTMNPAPDMAGAVDSGLANSLSPTQSEWDQWGAGWIPQDCKSLAEREGYSPSDFEVFNVHYTDCDEAWVMCRHKDSGKSQTDMVDLFGRIPLGMREFVKHIAVVPDIPGGAAAYSTGDSVLFESDNYKLYILVHELSHSLDAHARPDITDGQFSLTSDWKDNFNQDSAVVSDYAATSWGENFAESGVIGVYDKVVEGGFGGIQSNWGDVFHQYATYQGYMGDIIIPGSKEKCDQRIPNSETVPMDASAASRIMSKPIDTSFKTNIKIIEPSEFGNITHVCNP